MPQWNLKDDHPDSPKPKGKKVFSMPLHNAKLKYSLEIKEQSNGIKKLVIDLSSANTHHYNVLAMTSGSISTTQNRITLKTDIFSVIGMLSANSKYYERSDSNPLLGCSWFSSWMIAGVVPTKIIYENITPINNGKFPRNIQAGDKIGTMNKKNGDTTTRSLKLSFECIGSNNSNPKGMHPREFFSLLFWKKSCDPIFSKKPDQYFHNLLNLMMKTNKKGTFLNKSYKKFINENGPIDSWLGLRPPLRTFQRLKWEHIKEHSRDDFDDCWRSMGSIIKRIANPYIYNYGYVKISKCNVYAGEMLFRSGFKTIVNPKYLVSRAKCKKKKTLPAKMIYINPEQFTKFGPYKNEKKIVGKLHFTSKDQKDKFCSDSTSETHTVDSLIPKNEIAENMSINQQNQQFKLINYNIKQYSSVYLLADDEHVAIIDTVISGANNSIIDHWQIQNHTNWPIDQNAFIFEIKPGGDPTEEWGILELNYLTVSPKGP